MQPFDDGLAAQLETKWIDSGELTPEEIGLLETNTRTTPTRQSASGAG